MIEEGVVVEIMGDLARVQAQRSPACEGCGVAPLCHPQQGGEMIVEARNPVGARVGQRVRMEIPEPVLLKASFVVYIVPFLGLIGGALVGGMLGKSDLLAALGAFTGMILGFGWVRLYNQRVSREQTLLPVIVSVEGGGGPWRVESLVAPPVAREDRIHRGIPGA